MWDQRYDTSEYVYGTEPNLFLAQHYQSLPQGKILCLAEGEGRNAVFLAKQGYEVTAVDSSRVGLDKAKRLAQRQGVVIKTVVADLAEFDLGEACWDGVVSIFCHLPEGVRKQLHQKVVKALRPDGVFLLEAYRPKQLDYGTGGPPSVEMMMSQRGLSSELADLSIETLQELDRDVVEGSFHTGLGAVVQLIGRKI